MGDDEVEALQSEVAALLRRLSAPRRHHIASGLRFQDGGTVTGINLISNLGPSSVCAEQTALAEGLKYRSSPARLILTLRATFRVGTPFELVPPCGRCRELLCQFASTAVVAVPSAPATAADRPIRLIPVTELLPVPFVRRGSEYGNLAI